jgi:hypothetical protein
MDFVYRVLNSFDGDFDHADRGDLLWRCAGGAVTFSVNCGDLFWCARVRGMRPQGACYKSIPEAFWPLFDACGPAREADLGNPSKQPCEAAT